MQRAFILRQAAIAANQDFMTIAPFNAAGAIRYDLERGSLSFDGRSLAVAVPANALDALFKRAPLEIVEGFGRRLGQLAVELVRERVPEPAELTFEQAADALGGALALMGLGNLTLERWGLALVLKVSGMPLKSGQAGLAKAVVEAALQGLFDRAVRAVHLGGEEPVRLLIVAPQAASKVEAWVAQGFSWGELIEKLHQGAVEPGQ